MAKKRQIMSSVSIDDVIPDLAPQKAEVDEIEELVTFGENSTVGLNIRAFYNEEKNEVVPRAWLHRINGDGTSSPLMCVPLTPINYTKQYGGHSISAFHTLFDEKVWKRLEKEKWAQVRGLNASNQNAANAPKEEEEIPF